MPTIHVARDGAKLGSFSLEEIREGLRTGRFLPTDLGWQNGMADWRPLSEFAIEQSAAAAAPLAASTSAAAIGLPWEHREQLGFFKAFFETVSLLLTKPVEAFAMMKPEGGMTDPMLFALIGGSAGMIVNVLFQVLFQSFTAFGGGSRSVIGMFGMGWVVGYIVMMPVLLALGIFIGSGILHVCLMIVGGANRPFETTLRVVCFSCGAAYLFSMIPICGGLITAVYSIVLEIIGVSRAHETATGKAVMAVFLPLVVCCGVFLLFGILIGGFGASFSDYFNRH
ncbi:MAG: hypothetical protein DLM73_17555 [Chthoniobacterales bacterium]|nr:MAG: hypothetical protein DLM73_17555 [Chthoniobacterales bacterium]